MVYQIWHNASVASGLVTTYLKWDKLRTIPTVKLSMNKTKPMLIKRQDRHERKYACAGMKWKGGKCRLTRQITQAKNLRP